jgi:hypothetical protein
MRQVLQTAGGILLSLAVLYGGYELYQLDQYLNHLPIGGFTTQSGYSR